MNDQIRELTVKLVRMRTEALDVVQIIERLMGTAENLPLTPPSGPMLALPAHSRKYAKPRELSFRRWIFTNWQAHEKATPEGQAWKKGQPTPWSQAACAEKLNIADCADISKWLSGRNRREDIREKLISDTERMQQAGVVPVAAQAS